MKILMLLSFCFTLFNTGLIWTIQLVHYPGFLKVGQSEYLNYQQFHMKAITMLVGPSMLLELFTSGALLLFMSQLPSKSLFSVTFIILIAIWFHTAFWASPIHGKLLSGYNEDLIKQLISANWWRTFAWTARSVLIGWMVYELMK